MLGLVAASAPAQDLGARGATWPIVEPDLLADIEARLSDMEHSGELARLEDEARERAR
ncbi:MAG: type-F conjugative transfer system protein TraW, partial [Acidobacteria bacterium]|nr:type-F conjugative transfer system protein TraW [Acidobacteriota bacterium]